jgi:demethylmenaquinone methyltransferase/2-methoxy-6-polyprenyl-1,4-benzoquinol methylase
MIATQKPPALSGTRPEGSRDEREAAARVRDMFTCIAPRYDFLNHLLSFSLDHLWRRRTAKRFLHILRRPDARILDLCCGTGDLAFALARTRADALAGTPGGRGLGSDISQHPSLGALALEVGARGFSPAKSGPPAPRASAQDISSKPCPIIGTDFVEPMLVRAREKGHAGHHHVAFAAADALHVPFPDASFDLITTAFGFRNLANYEAGLREFARLLKPGGELGILEFTEPSAGPMAGLFRFYFKNILPRIGGAISGSAEAYKYLPSSVSKFPSPPELAALTERCGFRDVRIASWNFGSVILHSGRRD